MRFRYRPVAPLLVALACSLQAAMSPATAAPARVVARPALVTDPSAVFRLPGVAKPAPGVPLTDPTFGTRVIRIAPDPGTRTAPVQGAWGSDVRHVYSRQQPWNATGTLLALENRGKGASPSPILLDGTTYAPVRGKCAGYDAYDYRWHPSRAHANEQINVNRAGTELMWFDVVRCVKTRSWKLPFAADYGIGSGEGNVSADGRFVVIADSARMVVVDMDPRAPNAPAYPYRRIGPVYTLPACGLDPSDAANCPIGNVSISPSGRYIDVKYAAIGSDCDTLCDMHRIFEVDTDLVIRPHLMAATSPRCGSFAARRDGWVFPLKHADLMRDPFDGDEDVLVGGRACPGSTLGRVVKVRLRDGRVTSLTDPANEAGYAHGSGRATERPGWFYVTYDRNPAYAGRRFYGEVVALRIDGSGTCERLAHYHSSASVYRSQGQAVPSPDGRRVLFASDWAEGCGTPCGTKDVYQDYVIETGAARREPTPASVKPRRR